MKKDLVKIVKRQEHGSREVYAREYHIASGWENFTQGARHGGNSINLKGLGINEEFDKDYEQQCSSTGERHTTNPHPRQRTGIHVDDGKSAVPEAEHAANAKTALERIAELQHAGQDDPNRVESGENFS